MSNRARHAVVTARGSDLKKFTHGIRISWVLSNIYLNLLNFEYHSLQWDMITLSLWVWRILLDKKICLVVRLDFSLGVATTCIFAQGEFFDSCTASSGLIFSKCVMIPVYQTFLTFRLNNEIKFMEIKNYATKSSLEGPQEPVGNLTTLQFQNLYRPRDTNNLV